MFEEASAIRRKLAAERPARTEEQWFLAETLRELGDLERDAGDLAKAKAGWVQALDIVRKLSALAPTNRGWKREAEGLAKRIGEPAA